MPEPQVRAPPEALEQFLAPYGESLAALFYEVRAYVLARCPGANELMYDAYNAVSCVYSPTERPSDGFCHVVAYAAHVNLGFNQGAALDDPWALLEGSGKSIRHITVRSAPDLQQDGCEQLLLQAMAGRGADSAAGANKSIIKAVSDKKRRPAG